MTETATVTTEEAWDLIDNTQWPLPATAPTWRLGTSTSDGEKLELMRRLMKSQLGVSLNDIRQDPEKYLRSARAAASAFHAKVQEFYNKLDSTIDEVCPNLGNFTYVSDDSFSDVVHHIIGLGREEYFKVLNSLQDETLTEPDRGAEVIRRLRDRDYRESFAYVIPHEDDVDNLLPRTYVAHLEDVKNHSYKKDFMAVYPTETPPEGWLEWEQNISSTGVQGVYAMTKVIGLMDKGYWEEALEAYLELIDPEHGINPPVCNYLSSGFYVPNRLNDYYTFVKERQL